MKLRPPPSKLSTEGFFKIQGNFMRKVVPNLSPLAIVYASKTLQDTLPFFIA